MKQTTKCRKVLQDLRQNLQADQSILNRLISDIFNEVRLCLWLGFKHTSPFVEAFALCYSFFNGPSSFPRQHLTLLEQSQCTQSTMAALAAC